MFTTDLTTPFTTAELQAIQTLLQNETAWDRDADTGGFNAYHSADNPDRVLTPVHEEAEWKVLNSALLRIDIELERRKRTDQATRTNPMASYRTLAAKLEKAAVAKSWQGRQPPANWAQINKDLHDARGKLQAFVQSLLPKEDNQ